MKTINTANVGGGIVISIPVEVLVMAAEQRPSGNIKVIDESEFAKCVAKEIGSYATVSEADSGLTHFQQFLDDIIQQVAESGSNCINTD